MEIKIIMEKLNEELTGEKSAKPMIIAILLIMIAFSGLITVAVMYIIHELKNFL